MKQANLTRIVRDYLWITLGSVIYSISFNWFYVPNQIGFGGLTALGMILNHFSPVIPIGTVVLVLNIPLFLLGWKFLGWRTLVSSLFAMTATSLLVDLIAALYTFPAMDPMLAAIFGGVLLGVSMGMIFSKGATTGGTDIIVKLLRLRFPHLKTGSLFLLTDAVIVTASAFVFQDLDTALYAGLVVFINSVLLDIVLYGRDGAKMFFIISDSPERIVSRLLEELDISATYISGSGAYTGTDKKVVLCVVKKPLSPKLEEIVRQEDPSAFTIITSASEIYGEGYKSIFSQKL